MRILFLTQYFPPEFGAAAIRLGRLTRMLAAAGHTVTVLTSLPNYPDGVFPPEYRRALWVRERWNGVDVRRVWVAASPSRRARARLMQQFSFLATAALRGSILPRPDVIYVESHPLFVTLAGGWLRRVLRAPVVLNVSDLWPESAVATGALQAGSPLVQAGLRVERWAYEDACAIIAMTRGVYDGVLAVHPHPDRVSLIRNAVDLDAFHPATPAERAAARAALGLSDAFIALHAGNMSLTYDFDIILEAAERLPGIQFVFAGGGSQADRVRAAVDERRLDNVTLLGVLPHHDMPRLWAAADVSLVALADHSVAGGTLPAKLYESLATGTPVVAAIRGEGADLIHDSGGGIVVEPGDADGYTRALESFLALPENAAAAGERGAQFARRRFSAEHVVQAYYEVLERAAASS